MSKPKLNLEAIADDLSRVEDALEERGEHEARLRFRRLRQVIENVIDRLGSLCPPP